MASALTTFEPSVEPSDEPIGRKPVRPKNRFEGFDEWYLAYPRKVAKGAARKAFPAAASKAPLAELVQAARAYAIEVSDKEPQFVAHPATWLNGERWADQAPVAMSAADVGLYDDEDFAARQAARLGAG